MSDEKKKEKKTKVFIEDYKGNPMFAIWIINASDEKEGQYPVVSFGKTKAKSIAEHVEELKNFILTR